MTRISRYDRLPWLWPWPSDTGFWLWRTIFGICPVRAIWFFLQSLPVRLCPQKARMNWYQIMEKYETLRQASLPRMRIRAHEKRCQNKLIRAIGNVSVLLAWETGIWFWDVIVSASRHPLGGLWWFFHERQRRKSEQKRAGFTLFRLSFAGNRVSLNFHLNDSKHQDSSQQRILLKLVIEHHQTKDIYQLKAKTKCFLMKRQHRYGGFIDVRDTGASRRHRPLEQKRTYWAQHLA